MNRITKDMLWAGRQSAPPSEDDCPIDAVNARIDELNERFLAEHDTIMRHWRGPLGSERDNTSLKRQMDVLSQNIAVCGLNVQSNTARIGRLEKKVDLIAKLDGDGGGEPPTPSVGVQAMPDGGGVFIESVRELTAAMRILTARLAGEEKLAYFQRELDGQKRYAQRLKLEVDRLTILLQDAGVDAAPEWAKEGDDGDVR